MPEEISYSQEEVISSWAGIPYSELAKEQKEFLKQILRDKNRNYFLHGCAGSGKTVVAAHAAGLLKRESKSVNFLVFTKLLSKFVSDGFNDIGANVQGIDHFHRWKKLNLVGQSDVCIIDECQDFQSNWIRTVKQHSTNQIWLGDASQQIYADAMNDTGYDDIHSEFNDNDFELKINYRNSISIAQLAKCFINLNEFDSYNTLEEKVNAFILPIQRNQRQTAEANNQPNVFIEARNQTEEFDAIAQIIKERQESSELNKQIAIAQLHHRHLNIIQSELENRGIDVFRISRGIPDLPNFNDRNLTLLSTIHSLKGIEVDYIIFPRTEDYNIDFWEEDAINQNLLFVLFSRARKRIFCSYTNKEKSVIYKALGDDIDNDFFKFVDAAEVLDEGTPVETEEEISEKLENIESKLQDYFDDLELG